MGIKNGKRNVSRPTFIFKDISNEEVKDLVNKTFPIRLNSLAKIVDRIHLKYPTLTKTEISLIVRNTIESIRDLSILGFTINLQKFLTDAKFTVTPFFNKFLKDYLMVNTYFRTKTPVKIEIRHAKKALR